MNMRDSTMSALLQLEARAAEASGLREKQLVNFRNRVDDRKAELERLERKIFPTCKHIILYHMLNLILKFVLRLNYFSARPLLVQQDSMGSGELPIVEEENGSSIGSVNIEDIFQKLMKITGYYD